MTTPKRGNATNYRTLFLVSHTFNILQNIIKIGIKNEVKNNTDGNQFDFRPGKRTREALMAFRALMERYE